MPQNFDMMNTPEAAALLRDKAALKALLSSPETRRLMSALARKNGSALSTAAMQAKNGDIGALSAMVSEFAGSREGGELVRQFQQMHNS